MTKQDPVEGINPLPRTADTAPTSRHSPGMAAVLAGIAGASLAASIALFIIAVFGRAPLLAATSRACFLGAGAGGLAVLVIAALQLRRSGGGEDGDGDNPAGPPSPPDGLEAVDWDAELVALLEEEVARATREGRGRALRPMRAPASPGSLELTPMVQIRGSTEGGPSRSPDPEGKICRSW